MPIPENIRALSRIFRGHRMPITLALIMIAAASVRFLPLWQVFTDGAVRFFDGDCYLHMRKVLLHIRAFPHFVTHDYFAGYPEGTPAITPPLLDWLMAALSIAVGLGKPAIRTVESTAAVLPPLAGGITVLALYLFGRDSLGRAAGVLAALMLAVTPAHIIHTVVGRPDNEMLEPLMALLMFWGYLRIQNAARNGAGTTKEAVLTALTAMLALLLWRGATLWIGLLALGVICDIFISFMRGEKAKEYYSAGFKAFGFLGGLLLVFCSLNPWGNQRSFSLGAVSLFHVALFGATAAGLLALGKMADYWLKKNLPKYLLPVAIVVLPAVLAGIAAIAFPSVRSNIQTALGVLGASGNDPWLNSVAEYQPLLGSGLRPDTSFGWAIALVPVALIFLGREFVKENPDRSRCFVFVLMVCVLALTLLRSRFAHILALFTALSAAWAVAGAYCFLKEKRPRASLIAAAALSLLIYYPVGSALAALPRTPPGFSIEGYIEDAMLWVRGNTPPPGDVYDPNLRPPYGVLARWDFAGWIEYVAERPSVTTLYGTEAFGLKESARFFTATDINEAEDILRETGTRYLILVNILGDLPMYAQLAGRPETAEFVALSPDSDGTMSYKPAPLFFDLVSASLQYTDGMPSETGAARFRRLDHYRLLYESEDRLNLIGFPVEVKKLKIFEHVKGAKLKVEASPGKEVTVSAAVRTNRGRLLSFLRSAKADQRGVAEFTLPYGAGPSMESAGLVGPYEIESAGRGAALEITDGDVVGGAEHLIRLAP